jgi:predicted glycogen debranching enzyme
MINQHLEKEYVITNGLGSFCSGTVMGPKTRKYHGILNASLEPPIKRHLLISDLKTHIQTKERTYTLESQSSYQYLQSFDTHVHPTFNYKLNQVQVKKTIAMAYLENTTVVVYDILTQDEAITLQAEIFSNFRDHHDLVDKDNFSLNIKANKNLVTLSHSLANVYISGFSDFHHIEKWHDASKYIIESRRGQPDTEEHFSPGYFEITIPAHTQKRVGLVFTTEESPQNYDDVLKNSRTRLLEIMGRGDTLEQQLNRACDQFIVYRKSTNSHSVIAGYPWFTDWGRDTMIALRGLTLSTKRFKLSKSILETFLNYERDGLIPNMFPDENSPPMYNTIDGTLWMFVALYDYYEATNDQTFIKSHWLKLEAIINKHLQGTIYDIKVDDDGLLSGGSPSTQLTWMDVKIDGIVVTPRHGKAVEINSLWYNALKIMSYFSQTLTLSSNIDFHQHALHCYESFNLKFWNKDSNGLFDLIQDEQAINKIRPNQIFAVSLPFSLLDYKKKKYVVDQVTKHLLTPFGLRSLSPEDSEYIGQYDGDVYKRDFAYHQGTVWGWLMGPYLEAHYKVYKDKNYIEKHLYGLLDHLNDTGIGTLSEVFYGDHPHYPRGCFAQAWSVSEAMRIYQLVKE